MNMQKGITEKVGVFSAFKESKHIYKEHRQNRST